MIKAILFDLDNTLVDFMRMKKESLKAAIAAMLDAGLEMNYMDSYNSIMNIYRVEGIEYQEVFDQFLVEQLGRIDHKFLAAAIVAYRRTREATLILYPHVTSTLASLVRQGLRLAILTDAPPKQAWLRLCYFNLHHFFDYVITPEETGELKPSPKPFKLALKKLNVTASESLMVGDWPARDLVGAKNVGIRTVFARYGDHRDIEESGADYNLDDIADLLQIIKDLGFSDRNAIQKAP